MYNLGIKYWKVIKIIKGHGSNLLFTWRWTTKVWISNRIGDPSSPYPESMGIIWGSYIYLVSANAQMPRLGSKAAMVKLKKIGGSLYERWSVWFNPIIHEKSYQSIQKRVTLNLTRIFELFLVGTAWLSSVRVVECNIKLLNERNLYDKYYVDFLLLKQGVDDITA